MNDDWLKGARRRLIDRPAPGCWLALVVRAIEPAVADDGQSRAHTPAHFLVGAWRPSPDGLYPRLPEFAAIASPDGTRALRELFVHLPPDAEAHLVRDEYADAALLAEMVLACDRNLEPYQREALASFAAARRESERRRIAARYTDREDAFERFRAALPGVPRAGDAGAPARDEGEER